MHLHRRVSRVGWALAALSALIASCAFQSPGGPGAGGDGGPGDDGGVGAIDAAPDATPVPCDGGITTCEEGELVTCDRERAAAAVMRGLIEDVVTEAGFAIAEVREQRE